MPKTLFGPRFAKILGRHGSMGLHKAVFALGCALLFCGATTQNADASTATTTAAAVRSDAPGLPIRPLAAGSGLVGAVGTTLPTQTATLTILSSGTLSSITVSTQGAQNLDFNFISGGTCTTGTAYTAGQSCTVAFNFTPTHPGPRYGAVTLMSSSGSVLATTFLQGIGNGPQVNFTPGTLVAIPVANLVSASAIAVDAAGNLYITQAVASEDPLNAVIKETPDGSGGYVQSTIATGLNYPVGVAVDGAGNVYIADQDDSQVIKETLSNGSYIRSVAFSGLGNISGVAVDGAGNVYIPGDSYGLIKETLTSGTYVQSTISASPGVGYGITVDGSGVVYLGNGAMYSPQFDGSYAMGRFPGGNVGIAVDSNVNIFVAQAYGFGLYKDTFFEGSYIQSTIASGTNGIGGVAVDGDGNVFFTGGVASTIWKLDLVDPPSLSFATTDPGFTSSDSPQTVTIVNAGNTGLTFATPASGTNPSITSGFTISNASTCPQLSTFASPATLAPNTSCTDIISFSPLVGGPYNGKLTSTDDSLNLANATQIVPLNGFAPRLTPPPAVTNVSPNSGPVAGGTVVTITGSSFIGVTAVNFGATAAASFTVNNDTSITAITPAGIGVVDVTVTTPIGTSTTSAADLYTYVVPALLPQMITFAQPPPAYAGTAVLLSATGGGSSSPVVFSVVSGPAITSGTNGSTLTYTGAGTVVVEADQAGDAIYAAAPPVQHTVNVTMLTEPVGTTSPMVTTLMTFTTAGTLGVISNGVAADFQVASAGTCAPFTTYAAGQTCTVQFTFTPKLPGIRYGGILLEDVNTGAALADSNIYGTGVGPLVNYSPATQSPISGNFDHAVGVAVDGAGNLFVGSEFNNGLFSVDSTGTVKTINTSFMEPTGIAVDGSGNVFVTDFLSNTVSELLAPGLTTAVSLGTGWKSPAGIAVDGNGNVFVADDQNNRVMELTVSSGYTQMVTLAGSYNQPTGIVVDGNGNVFVVDLGGRQLQELSPSNNYATATILRSGLNFPSALAIDANANLYIATQSPGVLLKLTAASNYNTLSTIDTGTYMFNGVAVDGTGNVYGADTNAKAVVKLDYADPPSLSFLPTNVGSTSSDSPQTVTMTNAGNANLTFVVSGSGTNPSITSSFTLSGSSTCSQMSASSTPVVPNGSCTDIVSFSPLVAGPVSGTLTSTDDNLNVPNATQIVLLNGIGVRVIPPPVVTSILPNSGPVAGGTVVTISGSSFTGATAVNFGGTSATTFTVNSDTSITATAPAGTGTVDVTVTTSVGTSATGAGDLYTYILLPQAIIFTQPLPAYAGTAVLLSATGGPSSSPVVFSVISGPAIASGTNGSTLTYTGAGTVVVEADQAGDANYTAAAPVQKTVTVALLTEPVGTASATVTTLVTFSTTGTLGTVTAVTQGKANGEFNFVPGGTCVIGTAYTAGQTCTVEFTFTPQLPGMRYGGLLLEDLNTGAALANSHIYGSGVGPLVNYSPATLGVVLAGNPGKAVEVAVGGADGLFVGSESAGLLSIDSAGTVKTINSSFVDPTGVAVDGSGNVFVTDTSSNTVSELLAPGLTTAVSLGSGWNAPAGIAVDGNGNVFVADEQNNRVVELTASSGYTQTVTLGGSFSQPTGVAVDSNGNVFVVGFGDGLLQELSPSNNYATATTLRSGLISPSAIAIDANANVYIATPSPGVLLELTSAGGYNNPININTGTFTFAGVAVDGMGNVYGADTSANSIVKLDYADPPKLTFSATNVGSTSSDSPQTVTMVNAGNANLTFVTPGSGTNPIITSSFTLSNTSTCSQMSASSTPLAPNASCTDSVSFSPLIAGPVSGTLTSTDDNLNVPNATQIVLLNGVGLIPPPVVTSVSPNSGPLAGGTVVTISGSSFTGATAVSFGGTSATSFTVNSDTSITATAPAGAAAGAVDVTVTTPVATSATSAADLFTYVAPLPQTITFTPPASAYAGTAVLLSATGGASSSPVVFSVISGPAAVSGTNGSTLTYTGAGTVVVEADQAGDENYTAAPPVQKTVTVTVLTEPVGTASATVTTLVTFSAAGTLGTVTAVTQGKADGEFDAVTGGTCAIGTAYTAGQTCTVQFSFTPQLPGMRYGGLLLEDVNTGAALANSHIYGIGVGPLVNYSPATLGVMLAGNPGKAVEVAVGGADGLFVGSEFAGLLSIDSAGTVKTINSSFVDPSGVAVDGSGNVFVTDHSSNTVSELLAPALTTAVSLGSGWNAPAGLAVDGNGNVFVADEQNNRVVELTASSGYTQMVTLGGSYSQPTGVAVDSNGNVFVVGFGDGQLKELSPSNNYATATTLHSGLTSPSAMAIDANANLYIATPSPGVLLELTSASSYNSPSNINTGTFTFAGVAVDGMGNVYGADTSANSIVKLDYADPPTLTFSATNVGSTSSDSPQTVTMVNAGNANLTFVVPGSGTNPSITSSFTLSGASTCSQMSASSTPLAPNASCTDSVSFSPLVAGPVSGTLTSTDDNLNVPNATQIVLLNGVGLIPPPVVTSISPTSGPLAGGTVVAILGSSFTGATAVSFGGTSATSFTVNSDTSITATAPAGASAVAVDVTVTTPVATSATSVADLFTYVAPLPQTITFTQPLPAYAGTAVLLSAAGGASSSPVVFSVISGPAAVSGTNGSTLTYTGAGTVVVEADQAGDTNYTAAPPVQKTVTVTVLTEPVGTASATVTTLMTFTTAGTLGTVTGVTQGKANGEFNIVPGGNCAIGTTYTAGQICTVQFTFTPQLPGIRFGGLLLEDLNTGTVLADGHIYGIGVGPLVNYSPAMQGTFAGNLGNAVGVAADGAGNLYVGSESTGLLSVNQAGTVATINSSFVNPTGVAVDGSGNVFVTDRSSDTVSELLAPGLTTVVSLGTGWNAPAGIAVDGNGNVFVADEQNNRVVELTASSGYTQMVTLGGSYSQPTGVAVDGNGNVFVVGFGDGQLKELSPSNSYATATTLYSGLNSPSAIAIDANANLYIATQSPGVLVELTSAGGYSSASNISTGTSTFAGVAVDGMGNIYGADTSAKAVVKLDYADPPTLTFSATNVGSTSSDSPQTVTLLNAGNANLTFAVPSSGTNPSITPGFVISNTSTCPQLSTFSSSATLPSNASCTDIISFSPLVSGPDSGKLTSTDDNLNVPNAIQIIPLNGVGLTPPPVVTSISPNSGPLAGGTVVTISGSGFTGATAVNFGATSAASFTVTSDTSITATAPAGTAAGVVDVTVTTSVGTSATSAADLYTYVAPVPQTISFTQPASAYAGTAVLLSATGGPSSNPVVFSVISGPAAVSGTNGSTLTYTGAGTVVVEADQAGDATYAAATPVRQTVAVTVLTEPVGTTSPTVTTLMTFTTAGTLGTVAGVTQGNANGEFNIINGGTCAIGTAYTAGQTCTVQFTLTPQLPGMRDGGLLLEDVNTGAVLADSHIYGAGVGPLVNYSPAMQGTFVGNLGQAVGVALDGAGNLFVGSESTGLLSIDTTKTVKTINSSFVDPTGVAVDGSGNVFVTDSSSNTVSELLAPGLTTVLSLGTGWNAPAGIAVDGNGNVFVADEQNNRVVELTASSGYTQMVTLGGSYSQPTGVAVDGNGNVFVVGFGDGQLKELSPSNSYATATTLYSGLNSPSAIAIDANANLYIATQSPGVLVELTSAGGYSSASNISTGTSTFAGVAVDGMGNIYGADTSAKAVVKLDYADPPTLTFSATNVGSTSSDSPQTATLTNAGNANLTFVVPGSGTNPSITSGFTLSTTSTCPQLSASSSSATLISGASCTDIVSFSPLVAGPDSGTLTSTDNNLNVPNATQIIPLNGVGVRVIPPPVVTGILPNTGPVAGGTVVTISGSSFTGATAVKFGSTSATTFTVNSDTSITATAPAGTGAVDVTVTTSVGTSGASAADVYTYILLPQTITFTQPPAAYAGTAVLLSATGGLSSNPVVFSVISGPAAVSGTNGSILTYSGAGTVVVEADQAGDANYAAATPVRQTVTVTVLTEPVGTASATVTTLMTFTTAGTLGTVAGVTQGSANGEFSIIPGGTCVSATTYTAGQTCTVQFTFTPQFPGMRYGGLLLEDANTGAALADSHIYGMGVGPLVNYSPAMQGTLAGNLGQAVGVAVDGAGNVLVGSESTGLLSVSKTGTVTTINSSFVKPTGVAVDGSGNVFVTDQSSNTVSELLASGLTTVVSLGSGWNAPAGIAVDGNGNIFVADEQNNRVVELTASSGYTQMVTLGGSYSQPTGVAVDSNGNVFVVGFGDGQLKELSPSNNYATATTLRSGLTSPLGLAIDANANLYIATQSPGVLLELTAASGYSTLNNLGTGTSTFAGVAVDATGNIYGADTAANAVVKLDYADPPTLTFAATNVGSTSSDSPQTATLTNAGNANLIFAVPSSGNNPSITSGFTLSGTSTCPQLSTSSSSATLIPGASCTDIVSFSPLLPGPDSGTLTSTDNNLNVPNATQIILLNGVGVRVIPPPVVTSISPNSGPLAGGTVVAISGSGFTGATAVNFGTVAATSFTVNSDTSITATTPAGTAAGAVDVTVTTPVATSVTSAADLFTYVAPQPQTINFTQPLPAYAGTAVLLSATGGPSSSPVVFSVVSGPATATGTNGSTLTYTGAGTVVVEADQAGDANYTAAPPVQKTIISTILTEPLTTTSVAVPTLVTFSTSGTLGAVTALTQGKANGEFNIVTGGTCATGTNYTAGQTCTVDFSFTPAHPGLRYGAILFTDASGATLANSYVYGTGNGPQIVWAPGTQTAIGAGISSPVGAAVDGNGNIFLADMGNNAVEEILASDGSTRVVGSFPLPDDVAVDGSGNVFVISNRTTVSEILAVNGSVPANPTILTLYTGFLALNGVKVDANGNVFVANSFTGGVDSSINELLAVNGSIPANPTIVTVVSGIGGPTGVAIDVHGNVYFSDEDGSSVYEVTAVNGSIPANPVATVLASGFVRPANIAIDGAGNLFIPSVGDHTVKEILAVNGTIPANPTVLTLSTALSFPQGLAVDSAGNVLVADAGATQLVKLDYADPPSLTFAPTDVGATSTDSPQTVTMINDGNADLVFATPGAGANPSITPGFTIGSSSTCPQLSASSAPATLPAGASCTNVVSFTPIAGGPDSGKLISTDNDLDIPGSTQIVPLNGIGIGPPILTLTATPNPAAFGTTVTLTVTATAAPPATGTPTGTVELFNNGASLGTFPLSAAGVATLATSTLPAGTDTITCTYSGDPNFAPGTCNSVAVLITAAPSALTLTSSVNPSPALTPVTFTAHFSVNGQPAGAGYAIVFSVVQLPGGAVATFPATTDASGTASFTPTGFYPGTYTVSAAFTATANYQAASAVPITEVVNLNPTMTTLTASPNPAEQNQTVTFVATVTALAGTAPPNGTVTLLDGSTVLGTASAAFGAGAFSTATFTFSTLAPGVHSLSAVYTPLAGNSGLNPAGIPFGTANGAISFTTSQSAGLSLTITAPDFSLTADPPSISIQTQHHATMQLTLTSVNGWNGPVTLTCGTVPAWVTCELPPANIALGADKTVPVSLTIDTDQLLGFLASAKPPSRPWEVSRIALATLLPLTLLGFTRRRKSLRSLLMLASFGIFVSGLTGCGSNLYPQHTAPGVYNIPVTATGTNAGTTVPTVHTLNITLTVTP